jgi:septum site-determining protein MinC
MTQVTATNQKGFVLKGSLFTLSVMQLLTSDLELIKKQLLDSYSKAPTFFKNAPIIFDLQKLAADEHIDFAALAAVLHQCDMLPLGILNGSEKQQDDAVACNLGLVNNARSTHKQKSIQSEMPRQPQSIQNSNSAKIVTGHIRSGQQVLARGGDLIITSSVSPGAEILADGNIHVYGALNGRALAGMSGDKSARIFCSKLNAELVSIAGFYQTSEDLSSKYHQYPTQIFLVNDKLQIQEL